MKTTKTMQKGGSKTPPKIMDEAFAKRYPNYFGKGTAYDDAKKGVKDVVKSTKTVAKKIIKADPLYKAAKGTDDFLEKRYPNYFGKGTAYSKVKKGIKSVFQNGGTTKMKMVKKDGKMIPAFAADGKGKMMMGGAKPKAMYGASMKPDMMKKGGMTKKKNNGY